MMEALSGLHTIVAATYLYRHRRGWYADPAWIWILAQALFFLGGLRLLDLQIEADRVYFYSMVVGLVAFVAGAELMKQRVARHRGARPPRSSVEIGRDERRMLQVLPLALLGVFSIIVSALYVRAIGSSVFLDGLRSIISEGGPAEDIAAQRISTYSGGDRYLAPGYVNQFKNTLLPLLISYFYVRTLLIGGLTQRRLRWIILWGVVPLTLFFLTVTGQRAPVFYAATMMVILGFRALPFERARRVAVIAVLTFSGLFLLGSLVLGRSSAAGVSSWGDFTTLVWELPERFLSTNQLSGLIGFRYIYSRPIQWGAEWIRDLQIILPGKGGISTANEVHAIMHGSLRGTSPLSIWGSIWYNFGAVGIIGISFLLGVAYGWLGRRFTTGTQNLFGVAVQTSAIIVLGTWAVSGPFYLINRGLLSVVFLYLIQRLWVIASARWTERRHRYWRPVAGGRGPTASSST